MLNLPQLCLFVAASFGLLIVPGPAVLYIMLQSVQQGRIAGIVAMLGLELGTAFHVTVAAFGVSRLSASVTAFNLLKGLGAAYLIYLGIAKLICPRKTQPTDTSSCDSLMRIFWRGIIVEVFNPKTAFFFFTFLPQFVTPTEGRVASQVIILGLLFVGLAVLVDLLYALLAGSVRRSIQSSQWSRRRQHYVESIIYIALGVVTALSS